MDLDAIEGLNEVRPAVYRAALKLRSLQKLCQLHLVSIGNLRPILCSVDGSEDTTLKLSQEHVRRILGELFQTVIQELPGQVVRDATDQTTRLLFKLYDRKKTGFVLLRSVEAALIVLSGDTLCAKHRALCLLAVTCSKGERTEGASVSRNGLRVLLHDLSQVPAVVQESNVFGPVKLASQSCFRGVISASVGDEHFVSWLQSEPRLLLWLSTLYRLSVSEAVQHRVHCHACKAFPITGLRYRCLKCLNVHLCQNCFLTERCTRKHKPSHPVLEYCTQPSWKESISSLASSARLTLLPRRSTSRVERGQAVRAESYDETQYSASVSEQEEAEEVPEGLDHGIDVALPLCPPLDPKVESKAMQTEEPDTGLQRKASLLQKDLNITQQAMKDIQRDKWFLEKEFQVWKVAAQSEHDALEDRCTELEASMKVLIEHNQHLEKELGEIRHQAMSERVTACYGSDISTSPLHERETTSEKEWTASESPDLHTSCTAGEDHQLESKDEEKIDKRIEEKEQKDDEALHVAYHQVEVECNMDRVDVKSSTKETLKKAEVVGVEEKEEDDPHLDGQELDTDDLHLEESVQEEDSETGNSDEDEEKALANLVQRLQEALLLPTTTGSCFHRREILLEAAEEVGDAVCHFVSSFQSLTLPSPDLQ